jgi:hypothetical protein
MILVPRVYFTLSLLLGFTTATPAAQLPKEVAAKVDAVVESAYGAASAKLPCKISRGSNSRMLDWKDVDKCMNEAMLRVNWEEFSSRLRGLRPPNVSEGDFAAVVENSLARQALPFEKVFRVKKAEELLPLTNSILKYLPPNSLMDQPIFDQKSKQPIGAFAGVFFYERAGGVVTGNPYRLALFQYLDAQGKMQSPSEKLLLDSFGVPWGKAMNQPGFCLPTDKLQGIGRK